MKKVYKIVLSDNQWVYTQAENIELAIQYVKDEFPSETISEASEIYKAIII